MEYGSNLTRLEAGRPVGFFIGIPKGHMHYELKAMSEQTCLDHSKANLALLAEMEYSREGSRSQSVSSELRSERLHIHEEAEENTAVSLGFADVEFKTLVGDGKRCSRNTLFWTD